MKLSACLTVLQAVAALGVATPPSDDSFDVYSKHPHHPTKPLPLVDSRGLQASIKKSDLLKKAQKLEGFAYATKERNRYIGTPGHISTYQYLYNSFRKLSDYYTVSLQPFNVTVGSSSFIVDGKSYASEAFSFAPNGNVPATVVPVANLGCEAADYPAAVSGAIALISRGVCTFAVKANLAKAAGAKAAAVYNDARTTETVTRGTLGGPGDYIPIIGISQADGLAIIAAGGSPKSILEIKTHDILTYNVHAQTKGGDQDNVIHVGGHTDSVEAGPGINDNGSGTIGILETALQLTRFSVKNAVRFSFWSGEEEGLVGSTAYVDSLTQAELNKIRLYLNFDMIASPNYILGIYDGDGSAFNKTGPAGSAEAEKLFEDFFAKYAKLPSVPTDFSGRSDYGPFLAANVASGGLFTGAEVLKTAQEAILFGGQASVAYDKNYHAAGDNVSNLNFVAFEANTKAIAHAVATYGRSFDSLPPKNTTVVRRSADEVPTVNPLGVCGGHLAELK